LISDLYPKFLVSFLRPLIKNSNRIVFVANNAVNYYLGKEHESYKKIDIIYESIDIQYFNSEKVSSTQEAIKKGYDLDPDYKIIGFVGNINSIKGLEHFVDVARTINTLHPKTKFLIVGPCSKGHENHRKLLAEKINKLGLEKDIIFTGFLSRETKPTLKDIYSIFDIFLMTSISEGTPIVILEAMAMGLPVIAPNVGGISEQIQDEVTGFVYPVGNIDLAVEKLSHLINNPIERKKMGMAGRKRVKEMFSLVRCVDEHRNLYNTVNLQKLNKTGCRHHQEI